MKEKVEQNAEQALKVMPFMYGAEAVRVIERNGEPWFVAKDVCECIGLARTDSGIRGLEEDEKDTQKVSTLGGEQDLNIISEPGLYRLIMRSNKPEAKKFQKWVFGEVLPAIRKNGAYVTPQADITAMVEAASRAVLANMKSEFNRNWVLEKENAYLRNFAPAGVAGEISSRTGRPKMNYRSAYFTSDPRAKSYTVLLQCNQLEIPGLMNNENISVQNVSLDSHTVKDTEKDFE